MLQIVFWGLIANLALVSCECNIRNATLHDFDWNRFSGPRPWYVLTHHGHEGEQNFDCIRATFSAPEGNRSLFTTDLYHKRDRSHIAHHGYAINWNSTGYFDSSHSVAIWSGIYHVIAVDYDRYAITIHCREETHELTIYVGYRSPRPDRETVNEVHRELQDKNVDTSQMVEWSSDHCPQAESSAASGSSA